MKSLKYSILMLLSALFFLLGADAIAQPGKAVADSSKSMVKKEGQKQDHKTRQKGSEKQQQAGSMQKDAKTQEVSEEKYKDDTHGDTVKQQTEKVEGSQGRAYGKDKDGMEGKDFGQTRAEQAKMKQDMKKEELHESVAEGEEKVVQARNKIREAKEKLEKDKKEKKISEAEYQAKKEKIDEAENAVNELEQKIQETKEINE
ncbi:MAG: hypothetical protein JXB00_02405 [Bacteroidales bacterium]|nr:hypothetical protein [Bacteroidales bacterium]